MIGPTVLVLVETKTRGWRVGISRDTKKGEKYTVADEKRHLIYMVKEACTSTILQLLKYLYRKGTFN